jgi:hypothetical protein
MDALHILGGESLLTKAKESVTGITTKVLPLFIPVLWNVSKNLKA